MGNYKNFIYDGLAYANHRKGKTMKAMRKLIPAIAMLMVSLMVMSSASFAWFTMSRQVTAEGMNVSVLAPNNLMIKLAEAEDKPENYAESQTIRKDDIILQPASTLNGTDFFYVAGNQAVVPNSGKLNGLPDSVTSAGVLTTTKLNKSANGQIEGSTDVAYYDFKYTIKSDSDVSVVVNNVKVEHVNSNDKSINPVRVAVISGTGDSQKVKIFRRNDDARNIETALHNGFVVSNFAGEGSPYTVTFSTPDYKTTVDFATGTAQSNDVIATLSSSDSTEAITIRVWYEGQDVDCTVEKGAKAEFKVVVTLGAATVAGSGS